MKITEWVLKLSGNVEAALDKIHGKANGATRVFTDLQGKISGMESRFGSLKSAALGFFSIVGAGFFFNSAIQSFDGQAKANAQLQAALISTKAVAGQTFQSLEEQASRLQKVTLFEDDQTMGAQSLLLTFTKVRGEIYEKAIPAILDYATALKTDPSSAAMTLGKALNDPVMGITALRRAGVQFSQSQQDMIKKFVDTNQLAKAQGIILEELGTQFGGSAKAAALAGMGPMVVAQHGFADVMEKVGMLVAQVFIKMLPYILRFTEIADTFVTGIINNMPMIKDVLESVAIGVGLVSAALVILNINTIALTVAQWALNIAMLANPMYLIIAAIVAVIAAIVLLWKRSEDFRGFLYGFWESVKFIFTSIAKLAADVFGGWADIFEGLFTFDRSKIVGGVTRMLSSYADTVKKIGTETGSKWREGFAKGSSEVASELAAEKSASPENKFMPGGASGASVTPMADSSLKKGTDSISEGTKQVRNVTVNITKLVERLEIKTTNTQGASAGDIERQVTEILVRAIQGSEIALSN